ncbi:hypothetical protein [Aureivirga marina]|nr:hypothetical protein [Aureivirga marina]
MAVIHIPTQVVHGGSKRAGTKCGRDTKYKSEHWKDTNRKITCKNCLR